MLRSLFPLLLLLLLPAAGCSLQWHQLNADDGGFQVLMPDETERLTRTQTAPDGQDVILHYYLASYPAAAFLVMWRDFEPATIARAPSEAALDAALQGSFDPETQELRHVGPIRIGEHPGRGLQIFDPGTNALTQGRIYLVNARLYTVLATTDEGFADHPEVHAFLDSFELLQPSDPQTATPGPAGR